MKKTLFLLALSVFIPVHLSAGEEFFPLEKIQPGMEGIAKTVVEGTTISTLQVKILDVLPSYAPGGGTLLLIRISGPAAEKAGGIASGMSGSPIYLDGKLAGAISVGFTFSDNFIGGATYIGDMMKSLPQSFDTEKTWVSQVPRRDHSPTAPAYDFIAYAPTRRQAMEWSRLLPSRALVMYPLRTPFYLSAPQGSPAFAYLKQVFARFAPGAELSEIGGAASEEPLSFQPPSLTPGDALGFVLGSGILPLFAFGTLTYVDDEGRFLAFGHSALETGESLVPTSSIYVSTTVQSLRSPFKLGKPVHLVGIVSNDESASIGGWLGKIPRTIPLRVKIYDDDLKQEMEAREEITPLQDFFASIVLATISYTANRVMKRIGKGTARYEFEIRGEGIEPIQWNDRITEKMILSVPGTAIPIPPDISFTMSQDLSFLLNLLLENPYHRVVPAEITFSAHVTREEQLTYIQKMEVEEFKRASPPYIVQPGKDLHIQVTLKAYRGETQEENLLLTLPQNLPEGPAKLVVYGGSLMPHPFADKRERDGLEAAQNYFQARSEAWKKESLKDVLSLILSSEKNQFLVARLLVPSRSSDSESEEVEKETVAPMDVSTHLLMDAIVAGADMLRVKIEIPGKKHPPPEEEKAPPGRPSLYDSLP